MSTTTAATLALLAVACSFFFFFVSPAHAADPVEEESGVHIPSSSSRGVIDGGYGAPEMKLSFLAGDPTLFAGWQGAAIINRWFVVGGAGYGNFTNVVSPHSLQGPSGNPVLRMGYGGLRFGAYLPAERHKLIHATFGVLIGAGGAGSKAPNHEYQQNDTFLVLEPDLGGELNLAANVRLALSGSYRFVGPTELPGFSPRRLSGPVIGLSLRLGEF